MRDEYSGGWIYVMMTSSNYNRFKVGRTAGNPVDRAKQLRTGDPGVALQAAYFVPAFHGALSRVEADLRLEFGGRISFHDESMSEWFHGSAEWACQWIESVFEEWFGAPVACMHMFGQDRVCRAYEEDLRYFYGSKTSSNVVDGLPF
jgi:hypothetical protein